MRVELLTVRLSYSRYNVEINLTIISVKILHPNTCNTYT